MIGLDQEEDRLYHAQLTLKQLETAPPVGLLLNVYFGVPKTKATTAKPIEINTEKVVTKYLLRYPLK